MRIYWLIYILVAVISVSCRQPDIHYTDEIRSALDTLDWTIRNKSIYEQKKRERLDSIKAALASSIRPEERYAIYDRLYDEYYQYDQDSAMAYVTKKMNLSSLIEDPPFELIADVRLDIANRYVLSGMYTDAKKLLDSIDISRISGQLLTQYYHTCQSLYEELSVTSERLNLQEEYRQEYNRFRQLRFESLPEGDIARLYIMSDIKREQGKADEILEDLLYRVEQPETKTHEKAILNYIISIIYKQNGDKEKTILYLTRSAINDLRAPVNDYKALHELAVILYEVEDTFRAYEYITRAIQDALRANSSLNLFHIVQDLPLITMSYEKILKKRHGQLIQLLTGTSLLAVLLAISAFISLNARKRTAKAEKMTRDKNDELKKANLKLQEYVSMLQEANEVKESYLSRYMDMCVEYIEGLERYRSELRKTAKSGGFEKIMENLRTGNYIKSELQEFYKQFDATFLSLFPDFVPQLNKMLKPECRVEDRSSEKTLSTELRVMALIRLGINDSSKISQFLRRSSSTIYNYRVKMRNASICGREDFEKEIMHIGKV